MCFYRFFGHGEKIASWIFVLDESCDQTVFLPCCPWQNMTSFHQEQPYQGHSWPVWHTDPASPQNVLVATWLSSLNWQPHPFYKNWGNIG